MMCAQKQVYADIKKCFWHTVSVVLMLTNILSISTITVKYCILIFYGFINGFSVSSLRDFFHTALHLIIAQVVLIYEQSFTMNNISFQANCDLLEWQTVSKIPRFGQLIYSS